MPEGYTVDLPGSVLDPMRNRLARDLASMDTGIIFRDKSKPYEYVALFEAVHCGKSAGTVDTIIPLRVSERQLSKIPRESETLAWKCLFNQLSQTTIPVRGISSG